MANNSQGQSQKAQVKRRGNNSGSASDQTSLRDLIRQEIQLLQQQAQNANQVTDTNNTAKYRGGGTNGRQQHVRPDAATIARDDSASVESKRPKPKRRPVSIPSQRRRLVRFRIKRGADAATITTNDSPRNPKGLGFFRRRVVRQWRERRIVTPAKGASNPPTRPDRGAKPNPKSEPESESKPESEPEHRIAGG